MPTGRTITLVFQRQGEELLLQVEEQTHVRRMELLPMTGDGLDGVAIRSWCRNVVIESLAVYRRSLPRKANPVVAGDVLVESGNLRGALRQYINLADDYRHSGVGSWRWQRPTASPPCTKVVTNPNVKVKTTKDIVVGAGWKPGWSTDYDAVLIAKNHNVKTIINLTNIDYVYDKNPNEFPDARYLKEVDWKSFQRIVGDKWFSRVLSMPFNPKKLQN